MEHLDQRASESTDEQWSEHGVSGDTDQRFDATGELALQQNAVEACAHLLSVHPRGSRLGLRVDGSDDHIHVVAWTDVTDPAWPRQGPGDSLAWQVLSALTEGPSLDREDGFPAIRLLCQLTTHTLDHLQAEPLLNSLQPLVRKASLEVLTR